jgi:hypothetical protein
MSKQLKPRRSEIVQSSKQPSKVAVLAELLRVTEQAGTMNVAEIISEPIAGSETSGTCTGPHSRRSSVLAWQTMTCTTKRL